MWICDNCKSENEDEYIPYHCEECEADVCATCIDDDGDTCSNCW